MRPRGLALALLSLAAACGGSAEPTAPAAGHADGELQLFTLNRLEGYAEPIPCRPDAVSALAAASLLRDAAVADGDTALLLVVGDSLVPDSSTLGFLPIGAGLRARGQVVLEALAAARPDVWVPGKEDLEHDAQVVLERAAALGIPTLISNLAEGSHPEVLRSVVKQAGTLRVGFIGLLSPRDPDAAKDDDEGDGEPEPRAAKEPALDLLPVTETARTLAERLRRDEGVQLVVALSGLRPTVNSRLAQSGAVNLVVGGTDPKLEAGRIVIVEKAAMLSTLPDGREVGHTTLAIRDGNLQMADLSPMATLPAETETLQRQLDTIAEHFGTTDLSTLARLAMPGHEEDFVRRFSRLEEDREFILAHQDFQGSFIAHVPAPVPPAPADHPVLAALARQGEAIEQLYARLKRPIPPPPEGTPVIPAPEDCKGCHATQVEFWEQTAHAQAYQHLVERQRGRDATCLTCHAAAFTATDGWYDPRLDAPRGPVTCYSCHKATAIHSANRIYVLDSTQLIADGRYMDCMSCHQALRSPGFDRLTELPTVSCPPMRDDEPAIVLARERAVEALAGRAARGEAEPLDDYLMARGLIGLGRGEEGYKLLRDAARANTDNPRLAIEAARLFDAHGRSNDAIAVVRDYLAVRIGDPDVNLEHARLMLEAQDPQARDPRQALTQLELVIAGLESDDKRLIDFQLLKADALEALGQREQAIALLQSLAGRFSTHEGLVARLRRLVPQAPALTPR